MAGVTGYCRAYKIIAGVPILWKVLLLGAPKGCLFLGGLIWRGKRTNPERT